MKRLNKAGCGCDIAFLAAVALTAGLLIWLCVSLKSDLIEGWQEGPRPPVPTTSIDWTPFPTTTSKGTPPATATP
ncbi:hypothetical protein AB0L06_43485 [Spirillospora sp. NPDC052269]